MGDQVDLTKMPPGAAVQFNGTGKAVGKTRNALEMRMVQLMGRSNRIMHKLKTVDGWNSVG